ncbi:MAG: hypothetical protein V3S14_12720 [Anaerolineae bacterium]
MPKSNTPLRCDQKLGAARHPSPQAGCTFEDERQGSGVHVAPGFPVGVFQQGARLQQAQHGIVAAQLLVVVTGVQ